jgi:hypothetical protein
MALPIVCLSIVACGKAEPRDPVAAAAAAAAAAKNDPNKPAVVAAPPVVLPSDTAKKDSTQGRAQGVAPGIPAPPKSTKLQARKS